MKNSISFLFLGWISFLILFEKPLFGASFGEKPPLIIAQGEQRLLAAPGLKRFTLGSSSVRAVPPPSHPTQLREHALLLKGVSPGSSDLWIWFQDGRAEHRTIRVEPWKPDELPSKFIQALGLLSEVEVIPNGEGYLLTGTVTSLSELKRIHALVQSYPKWIQNESLASSELLERGQSEVNAWMSQHQLGKKIRSERIGQSIWIRGGFDQPREGEWAKKSLISIFPALLFDLDLISSRSPTIYFRVFLVELKRDQFRSLGLSWPGEKANAFQVAPWNLSSNLNLDIALKLLSGNGEIKILSNPELVVRAPGEAELFAGGEFPIRNKTHLSSNVIWKPYGLHLKLNVTEAAGSHIRLEILSEMSYLNQEPQIDEVPSIRLNRMKTQVGVTYGKPLLLCGLLHEQSRTQAKGLPVLRDIPILGSLFGSEDYLHERSELVAILYPQAQPPEIELHHVQAEFPKGPVPPPRNWVSPTQERELKEDTSFPWNVFNLETSR